MGDHTYQPANAYEKRTPGWQIQLLVTVLPVLISGYAKKQFARRGTLNSIPVEDMVSPMFLESADWKDRLEKDLSKRNFSLSSAFIFPPSMETPCFSKGFEPANSESCAHLQVKGLLYGGVITMATDILRPCLPENLLDL